MADATVLVVLALAAFRITRLVSADAITESLRIRWFSHFSPELHPLGQLVDCSYCAGFWVSAAVFAIWKFGGRLGWWIVVVWAVAGLQALLSAVDGRLNG